MTAPCFSRRVILTTLAANLAALALPPNAVAEDPVLEPVHRLNDGLMEIMKAGATKPFSQRFDILAPLIDQTFDLTSILKASVGPDWDTMSPDQESLLIRAFRRYTVASYVNSFNAFDGQRFVINPETRTVGDEQVVRTQIIPLSGEGHSLDYVMREGPMGWRIVDVLADGAVSRVAVQRSDFRRLLRQGGAIELAKSLDAKSDTLAG